MHMKKFIVVMSLAATLLLTGVSYAYTVKVVNCSNHNIIVTVAASYLVTAQDHLTIVVPPNSTNTGDMGVLLSAGYRVAVDRGCATVYNPPGFTGNGFARSFQINVLPNSQNGCVKVVDSWYYNDSMESCP